MSRRGWLIPLTIIVLFVMPSFSNLQSYERSFYTISEEDPWEYIHGLDSGSEDHGYGIATDSSGNTYVTGSFSGASISFGTTTLTNTMTGTSDVFIAKLDDSGVWSWALSGLSLIHI